MAKDRSEEERAAKKARREAKAAGPAADAGIAKKKDKKKARKSLDATTELLGTLDTGPAVDGDGDVDAAPAEPAAEVKEEEEDGKAARKIPLAALVPFANPLCDEKNGRKVLRAVKKAAKAKALKRGVKEVVKALRKSPASSPSALALALSANPAGIVVLAADISPMDVISHLPVLCEDHAVPYVFLPSRAELGAAGMTKRPTSVVMVMPPGAGKGAVAEKGGEWEEGFGELVRLARRVGEGLRV